jgi:xanthine dehydrogenase accessory factor
MAMISADDDDELGRLLATLPQWAEAGHRCAIATVVRSWGSAPRRAGSHLIIRDDGLFEGSVSGGCVEGDVIATALELLPEGSSKLLEYGVSDARAWEVGLACGGQIQVLVQPIADGGFPMALLERVRAARAEGRSVSIATDLTTGESREGAEPGANSFVNVYQPRLRLAVIGAVHIAQFLLPMARMAGYATVLIDPRSSFATAERFRQETIDGDWPDTALARWRPDAASAVVALTHDAKLDDPALIAALRSDAFYIAALGSRRNHASRLERLAEAGFTPDQLDRIHGPAGLAIGATNPAEIAVSVLAQMTASLRGAMP